MDSLFNLNLKKLEIPYFVIIEAIKIIAFKDKPSFLILFD
jgi:hypothetical protein